jgi:hypothetical protein
MGKYSSISFDPIHPTRMSFGYSIAQNQIHLGGRALWVDLSQVVLPTFCELRGFQSQM